MSTESTALVLHSYKASPTLRDGATGPQLTLVFDQELPDNLRHEPANAAMATSLADWEGTWRRFYADEATKVVDALAGALPGGLTCALLADLARRQAGIFVVAVPDHWRAPACVEEIHTAHEALDEAGAEPGEQVADRIRARLAEAEDLRADAVRTVTAERDEARRDAAHLRKPYTIARRRDDVTDWAAEAIARAPLLVGLVASAKSNGPTPADLFRVQNDSPRGPLTLTQEGAVEVFLESGPAAMVALVAERADLTTTLDAANVPTKKADGTPLTTAERVATLAHWANLQSALVDVHCGTIDELRLEILALRGDSAGATSAAWVWRHPCWYILSPDGGFLAKVPTTNLLIRAGADIEQATSVRDGMRRCEARLGGGGS